MIKSKRGGVLTAVVGLIIFLLVLVSPQVKSTQTPDQLLKSLPPFGQNDLGEYLYGAPDYAFQVDSDVQKDLQLNVDLTVAMPCRCKFLTFPHDLALGHITDI